MKSQPKEPWASMSDVGSTIDIASLDETAYLLQNPANAQRLPAPIEGLESGTGAEVAPPQVSEVVDHHSG